MRINMLLASALLVMAGSASAVTFTSSAGAPDPGPAAGQSIVVSFDGPNAAGWSFDSAIATSPVSLPGAAAPAGDATTFGYVSSANTPNNSVLTTPGVKTVSFYWGSIDTYNTLDIYGPGNTLLYTITGNMLPPANGDQGASITNRRIFITAGAGETITALDFRSTGVAFEFDTIAAAVPEPATWAMLFGGFGLIGLSARRRRIGAVAA